MDELIAWGQITIPTNVLQGETHEDWYPLNGKQGDGVEGMINLVLSYTVCFLGLKFSYFIYESCRFSPTSSKFYVSFSTYAWKISP